MKNNKIKKEKYIPPKFEKIKIPIWKVNDFKDIIKMAIPIFIQLAFNVIITQINIIAINWYMNEVYSEAVSKAVLTFNTLQFIPSLIATGTIVVSGNLIGQGRKEEVSKVIVTGVLINFFITLSIFSCAEIFSDSIVKLMSAKDVNIPGTNVNELRFVSSYYRLLNIQLLIMSISQVFIGGLQAIKKSTHVTIGAVCSNVLDAIFATFVLFVFKINPLWSALSISFAGFFQAIYMIGINFKFINFRINKGKQLNKKYAWETIKTGLPITLEMGIWFMCNFVASGAISRLGTVPVNGESANYFLVLHRSINSIGQYSFAFTQALGTVTAVFVSRKIGSNDIQGAYEIGIDCWKTAVYASVISGLFIFTLTWPLLIAFNTPREFIFPLGLTIFGLLMIKQIFDTVNLTLLRACWAAGDLWFPLVVSIFCMSLGMIVIPMTIIFGFNIRKGLGLELIYIGFLSDPILRACIYVKRWLSGKWQKYAKIIQ